MRRGKASPFPRSRALAHHMSRPRLIPSPEMSWREFEILGAYRESGEPALLRVEAASEDDAIEFAASRGVLISRVVDRTGTDGALDPSHAPPPRHARSPAPPDPDSPSPHIRFASRVIPDLDILPGERLLVRFDATPSEIGLAGILLAHRRRLVVTSHRVIVFDRRFFGSSLAAVPLAQASALIVGARVDRLMLALGAIVLFLGAAGVAASGLMNNLASGGPFQAPATSTMLAAYGSLALIVGALIMLESRSRVVGVESAGVFHGLRLRRFKAQRVASLVNILEHALHTQPRTPPSPPA